MELVLSQPISRMQVYLQHAFFTVAGMAVLVAIIWLAMATAVWNTEIEQSTYPVFKVPFVSVDIPITYFGARQESMPMYEKVQPRQFMPGIINLFTFGFFMTGFSMMFSSWDRFRWRTLGIVVGIYFVQAMIKVGAVASAQFSWLKYFTYFSLYEPALSIEYVDNNPQQVWQLFRYTETGEFYGLAPLMFNVMLIGLGLLCFWIGGRVFNRRDLPAAV
jgi:ABC-2 type transport system permease protein